MSAIDNSTEKNYCHFPFRCIHLSLWLFWKRELRLFCLIIFCISLLSLGNAMVVYFHWLLHTYPSPYHINQGKERVRWIPKRSQRSKECWLLDLLEEVGQLGHLGAFAL